MPDNTLHGMPPSSSSIVLHIFTCYHVLICKSKIVVQQISLQKGLSGSCALQGSSYAVLEGVFTHAAAVVEPCAAEMISTPGAMMLMQLPPLEKRAMPSPSFMAPTVITEGSLAGL